MTTAKHLTTFTGKVLSDRMAKTRVVEVERMVWHPKYKKQYRVKRTFKVHDEDNATKVGDVVSFIPCRPLSREKRWRMISKSSVKVNQVN